MRDKVNGRRCTKLECTLLEANEKQRELLIRARGYLDLVLDPTTDAVKQLMRDIDEVIGSGHTGIL